MKIEEGFIVFRFTIYLVNLEDFKSVGVSLLIIKLVLYKEKLSNRYLYTGKEEIFTSCLALGSRFGCPAVRVGPRGRTPRPRARAPTSRVLTGPDRNAPTKVGATKRGLTSTLPVTLDRRL